MLEEWESNCCRGPSVAYGEMCTDNNVVCTAQVAYMVGTLVALDYLHDTWFYWTHRALHWRPLYANIHYMHHQCVPSQPKPTPKPKPWNCKLIFKSWNVCSGGISSVREFAGVRHEDLSSWCCVMWPRQKS